MEQSKASLKITGEIINKLTDAHEFNQSIIIVLADHGWNDDIPNCSLDSNCVPGRTSKNVISYGIPLLLIKPINVPATELKTSKIPVTIGDIPKTISAQLNISNTFHGYNILDSANISDRIRYFYSYSGLLDEQNPNYLPVMQQYEISNFSWDGDSWEPTYRYYSSKGMIIKYPPVINDTTIITFGKTGNANDYLVTGGWSFPENGFTWTLGKSSTISFEKGNIDKSLFVNISFSPYLDDSIVPVQKLYVYVNGFELNNFTLNKRELQQIQLYIPHDVLKNETQYITLYMPNATSPHDTGTSTDERKLGIAVNSITLSKE